MLNCLLEVFETYQTFIVGLIGFIGVMYTISTNSKLSRNQHDREIRHQKLTTRTALIQELNLLNNSYNDRIDMFTKGDHDGSALVPVYVANDVYLQLIPKIGLLTPKEIKLVMTAYQLANELPIRLEFMAVKNNDSNTNSAYINIDNSHFKHAAQLHKNFLSNINLALSELNDKVKK